MNGNFLPGRVQYKKLSHYSIFDVTKTQRDNNQTNELFSNSTFPLPIISRNYCSNSTKDPVNSLLDEKNQFKARSVAEGQQTTLYSVKKGEKFLIFIFCGAFSYCFKF